MSEMTTKALAQWFGSNRTNAHRVGIEMGKCEWAGIPFMGGATEIPYILARTGVANDLHRHVINLARVVRDPKLKAQLVTFLDVTLFHPDSLADAQRRCLARDGTGDFFSQVQNAEPDFVWALDYFIATWMGRGGKAGSTGEFKGALPVRWNANGGDSATRFHSAATSLDAWSKAFQPWNFTTIDAFEFLAKCKDLPGHSIYVDAPWPGAGDEYKYPFGESDQRKLAKTLAAFTKARIVVRFADHPLIRELYPTASWNWIFHQSRDQAQQTIKEVLILNGSSFSEAPHG